MSEPAPDRSVYLALAERLSGPERARVLDRLLAAGRTPEPPVQPVQEAAGPTAISIWQPRERDGELYFERPRPGALGDHYATWRRIRARKEPTHRRVCWFGESAAAGYLCAPHLTPAGVLQRQLDGIAGELPGDEPAKVEVVDLARTNERLETLVETVRQAAQLDPDLFVIFAGNNLTLLEHPEHSPHFPSLVGRRALARALRADGLAGPATLAARAVLETTAAALQALAEISDRLAIPVMIVVPEINLLDWETREPFPWLPGRDLAVAYELESAARECLAQRRWADLERVATQLLELHPLVGPAAQRLLAHACHHQGRERDATSHAREEVAACHLPLLGCLPAPQVSPMLQEMLRRGARHHRFECVDLPAIFERALGSEPPDRRLFLDYCHLTERGMEIACAAVAATIARHYGHPSASWRTVQSESPDSDLTRPQRAVTYLGAAVHTAHRMLPVSTKQPILRHWLRAALEADAGVRELLRDLVAARCSPLPLVLTESFDRIQASAYRMNLQHGLRWAHIDSELVRAALETFADDPSARARIVESIAALAPTGDGSIDLSQPPYLWEPVAQPLADAMDEQRSATVRCVFPETDFVLPSSGRAALRLRTVLRAPWAAPGSEVTILLNGLPTGTVPASACWARHDVSFAGGALERGLNRLTIRWPFPDLDGERALQRAADRLDRGLEAGLCPIFGEVFALRLGLAGS